MKSKLSVTIITKNEAVNISRCLNSVSWADEIVVVDSGSTDDTLKICREYNCRIIESNWLGFGKTKQLAVAQAENDWILSIDADEELTPELQLEIRKLAEEDFGNQAYKIKRTSYYLGKKINFCGWQNDAPLRLFNRKMGGFNDKALHESVITHQQRSTLKNRMEHHTYPTLESHFRKMKFYGVITAEQLKKKGKKSSPFSAYIRGLLKFFKMYLLQFGFLDGINGFRLCKNSAWGVWYKYKRLWELN